MSLRGELSLTNLNLERYMSPNFFGLFVQKVSFPIQCVHLANIKLSDHVGIKGDFLRCWRSVDSKPKPKFFGACYNCIHSTTILIKNHLCYLRDCIDKRLNLSVWTAEGGGEGDMRKGVVCSVPSHLMTGFLPEQAQLILQLTNLGSKLLKSFVPNFGLIPG